MDPLLPFATAFLLGVAGAVYVLVRGVERVDPRARSAAVDEYGRERLPGRIALLWPFAAATLALFGLIGYLLVRWSSFGVERSAILAFLAAACGAALFTLLVRRWARQAAHADVEDERFVLQGHVARVVSPTAGGGEARVEYEANGRRVLAVARPIDQSALTLGADVVISHVEDGIVYVEPWSSVEERL
jgi:membrane protein implicated in regulation of membrane protease activity